FRQPTRAASSSGLAQEPFGRLAPLLVVPRLPPLLVRRAGADPVHVGAEVLAACALALAGAVRRQAEVGGRDVLWVLQHPLPEIAALEARLSDHAVGRRLAPDPPRALVDVALQVGELDSDADRMTLQVGVGFPADQPFADSFDLLGGHPVLGA